MIKIKKLEATRRTGPLDENEWMVLARLFRGGDRLAFPKVIKDAPGFSPALGMFFLQDRGWVRMRHFTLELTNRFRVEMPELHDADARQTLINQVALKEAAHAAAQAELKNKRWSIVVLFLAWGAQAADGSALREWRDAARVKYDDLLELLRSDGFDATAELHRAVMAGDRDRMMELARDAFDGIPRSEIVAVLDRHASSHLLLRKGEASGASQFH